MPVEKVGEKTGWKCSYEALSLENAIDSHLLLAADALDSMTTLSIAISFDSQQQQNKEAKGNKEEGEEERIPRRLLVYCNSRWSTCSFNYCQRLSRRRRSLIRDSTCSIFQGFVKSTRTQINSNANQLEA